MTNLIGAENVLLLLINEITKMARMINVGKSITAEQVVFCAQMITERHKDLRPDDVKLFCKKMTCGDYGKFYDKLDVQTIIEAMSVYETDRLNAIIETNIQQNDTLKQENKTTIIPPDKAEKLKELIAEFGKPKEKHPDFGNRAVIPPPKN